eukprot:8047568-Pyramimonas_sp.AAC.1
MVSEVSPKRWSLVDRTSGFSEIWAPVWFLEPCFFSAPGELEIELGGFAIVDGSAILVFSGVDAGRAILAQ